MLRALIQAFTVGHDGFIAKSSMLAFNRKLLYYRSTFCIIPIKNETKMFTGFS
jgi:hypothetical protein